MKSYVSEDILATEKVIEERKSCMWTGGTFNKRTNEGRYRKGRASNTNKLITNLLQQLQNKKNLREEMDKCLKCKEKLLLSWYAVYLTISIVVYGVYGLPIDRWMKGCILSFPKTGDFGLTKNYQGITLTSIAATIYNAILRNHI